MSLTLLDGDFLLRYTELMPYKIRWAVSFTVVPKSTEQVFTAGA